MCVDSDVQSSYMVTSNPEYVTCCLCGGSATYRAVCIAISHKIVFKGNSCHCFAFTILPHTDYYMLFTYCVQSTSSNKVSRHPPVPQMTAEWKFCLTQFIGNGPTGKSCFYFSSDQALFCAREKNSHTMLRIVYGNKALPRPQVCMVKKIWGWKLGSCKW